MYILNYSFFYKLGGNLKVLGTIFSIYAVSEFGGQVASGFFYHKVSLKQFMTKQLYYRLQLLVSISIGIIGSLLIAWSGYYSEDDGRTGLWFLLIGRLLQGLWSGSIQVSQQAYIAEVLIKDQNLKMNNDIDIIQSFGFPIGPLLCYIGYLINIDIPLTLNWYTSTGYFQCAICILMLFATLLHFEEILKEFRRNYKDISQIQGKTGQNDANQLFLSNQSDIMYSQQYIFNNQNLSNSQIDVTRYQQKKTLINIASLSEEEIKTMYSLPPNFGGLLITFYIFFVLYNSFSIVEVIATPLITDQLQQYTTSLTYQPSQAYILFIITGSISMVAYLFFRKLIRTNQKLLDFNDKNYLLWTLLLSLLGSIVIIDYQKKYLHISQIYIGIPLLFTAFVTGKQVVSSMFAKIVGNFLRSIYLTYSFLIIALSRILAVIWNVHALSDAVLYISLFNIVFLIAAIFLMLLFQQNLTPHYSYIIEKQKEMIKKGESTKDLRLIQTPEYNGLPVPLSNSKNYNEINPKFK